MPSGKISPDNARMAIILPRDLKEKLDILACKNGRSTGNLVRWLITNYVNEQEKGDTSE